VHPGDTLIILPVSGVERKVVRGDTLKSLAKKYGADADEIATFNGLDSSAPLEVGSTIIIPGGELSVPAAVKSGSSGRVIKEPLHGAGGVILPGYFINPVPGAVITQGLHGWNGVDLGAVRGTPIYAAADGVVIIARSNGGWNGGYGNYVVITHNNGSQTLYSHMRSAVVGFGQMVSQGQLIGYVGATGLATGPHLHFEVRGAANPLRNCSLGSVCSAQ
jgi:murein DD-endopeptidase MepM/ murein hydrolase activator NlpD